VRTFACHLRVLFLQRTRTLIHSLTHSQGEAANRAQLRVLLETRRGDLALRAMLWRAREAAEKAEDDEDQEAEGSSEDAAGGDEEGEMSMELDEFEEIV
jgi:hypothetical protein